MTNSKRVRVVLHLFVGGGIAFAAVFVDQFFSQFRVRVILQVLIMVIGLGILAIGFSRIEMALINRVSTNFCLLLLSLFAFIAVAEAVFRSIDYDFAEEARAWRKIPIYYRQPIMPIGDVFFKRPGPESWTGQVLNTRVRQQGFSSNPYTNEPVVSVEYDRRGFRNPDHLSAWKVAVAGDSFTELGFLPYEQLFTTILAQKLNASVLNLGVSYTGPLTQLSYLKNYGITAATEHIIIVFYEGNDLEDLAHEFTALVRFRKTGERDFREFKRQPSPMKALVKLLGRTKRALSNPSDAYFKSSQGHVSVTLGAVTQEKSWLLHETRNHLKYFFREYGDFKKGHGWITAWLAFLPVKRSVLYDHIEFPPDTRVELKSPQPTGLTKILSGYCEEYGIRFIDLTPALISETNRSKQLLYNSLHDTHLNSLGSLIVGHELARNLSRYDQ